MSHNPFSADAAIRARIADWLPKIGAEVNTAIGTCLRASKPRDSNLGGVLERTDVDRLVAAFSLTGVEDLMLLALNTAQQIAHPPISDFHVGAVGLEAETGNLVLGGNVEFPGTHLGTTVHGEGFVFTRAFSRGTSIRTIAIGEAHPCAHCRQYLSEFAATRDLTLIDPLGHRLTMAQLYPWPFDPDYLGETGAVPGRTLWTLAADRSRPAQGRRTGAHALQQLSRRGGADPRRWQPVPRLGHRERGVQPDDGTAAGGTDRPYRPWPPL